MDPFVKSEPIEYEYDSNENQQSNNYEMKTSLERCFDSEAIYLKNLDDNILRMEDDDDLQGYMNHLEPKDLENFVQLKAADLKLDDLFKKLNDNSATTKQAKPVAKLNPISKNPKSIRINDQASNTASINSHLEILNQKKRILDAINEMTKEHDGHPSTHLEPINVSDERKLLTILNRYLSNEANIDEPIDQHALSSLRRFVRKLELRRLKRKRHVKLFDIDCYANELIDHERTSLRKANTPIKAEAIRAEDSDVIFESEVLKTSADGDCEIVAVRSVLDRFKAASSINYDRFDHTFAYLNLMPIGMVESATSCYDNKCLISSFTNRILRPFIRRDYESMPKKLYINRYMMNRKLSDSLDNKPNFVNYPIDYVHLRPEHVLPINAMCRQHFWNGIDVTECLAYPDYTCVVMYRKLIIGFALMVPQTSTTKENYLSFIFVHPDWRRQVNKLDASNCGTDFTNCSIAHYLLFYLIQVSH